MHVTLACAWRPRGEVPRWRPEDFGDAAWPILALCAGYRVGHVGHRAVDGLDWETPDHYGSRAAGREAQRRLAAETDRDADRWAARVRTAQAIVEEALAAMRRPLLPP